MVCGINRLITFCMKYQDRLINASRNIWLHLKKDKIDHRMYSTYVIIYKKITNIKLCTLSTRNHLILVRVSGSHSRLYEFGRKYSSSAWEAWLGNHPSGKRKIRGRIPVQQSDRDRPKYFSPYIRNNFRYHKYLRRYSQGSR